MKQKKAIWRSFPQRFFSFIEQKSSGDKFLFLTVFALFVAGVLALLIGVSSSFSIKTPGTGGTFVEGAIGAPRFVNPALAITRTDQDLTALVYSGLMRLDKDGTLQPDLAESLTISEDGTVYNVVLKDNIRFHDDTPITAADVAFTIGVIQDTELKSPLRGNWNGVRVEVISPKELNFVIDKPFTPFKENLTLGILPKHIWSNLALAELPFSLHNIEPVGSGPFEVAEVIRNNDGLITKYTLRASKENNYNPNISKVEFQFFADEDALITALKYGDVTGTAALSNTAAKDMGERSFAALRYPLPRVFSLFSNQNRSLVLRDQAVREAIATVINRQTILDEILIGYGNIEQTPVPKKFFPEQEALPIPENRIEAAKAILSDGGWEQSESGVWSKVIDDNDIILALTISTTNTELFASTAELIRKDLLEIGVSVEINAYEPADFLQSVVRPRDYQLLLFGADVDRSLDIFPFWHSSQREDPGLNVALYTNLDADVYLERIRETNDTAIKKESLNGFLKEFNLDLPAIPLVSPEFVYVVRDGVTVVKTEKLSRPHERFSTIQNWHLTTEQLWPIFR